MQRSVIDAARRWRWPVAMSALIAVAAQVSVPLGPLPITLQSAAVLLAGATLGARGGTASVALYLAAAALGAPVLAHGASGIAALRGPTAGYLYAFVVCAWVIGRLRDTGQLQRARGVFVVALAVHGLLLALGGAWLASYVGVAAALRLGVVPFVPGAVVKSLLVVAAREALTRAARPRAPSAAAPPGGAPEQGPGPRGSSL